MIDEETSVAGALDALKALPPPPLEDHDRPEADPSPRSTPDRKAAQKSGPQKASAGRPSEKQAAALSNELEKIGLLAVGSLRSEGAATLDVLKRGEIQLDALDRAAESRAGVGVGTGELMINPTGAAIRPGPRAAFGTSVRKAEPVKQ